MIATHYHRPGPVTPDSMKPSSMNATFRAAVVLSLALVGTLGAGGCVYRPNIQQGNLLKVEDVDQVQLGMTRSQVRYLLGTPMLADPFEPQRWDYIYTLQRGRERKIDRAHFVVYFEGDKVSRVDKLDLPDERKESKKEKKKKLKDAAEPAEGTREPPPLPSIEQPPPDAPRPGSDDNF
jgi:outer membrane protein assembly factor BamE